MMIQEIPEPTPHEARRIAAEACVCTRTVRRFFAGQLVRSTCRARIQEALAKLGIPDPTGRAKANELGQRKNPVA
jgi:hypothetical protein